MKIQRLITLLLVFLSCNYSLQLNAQSTFSPILPDAIPLSAQAAQFARYGEIPVGHTTGVPQINIPLYTLSTGKMDIPISISYHASGFRVNDIPSPVGLGWVLNAGGLISRSVEGIPDYQQGKEKLYNSPVKSAAALDSVKAGRKFIYNPPINMSLRNSVDYWETFFTGHTPVYDIRSDRYFYNFLGHNGVGRYNINDLSMQLKTIPYEPLNFTYLPSSEKYQVTDCKGVLYEFAELDHTNVNGVSQSTVTGWYLTKIVFPGLESDPVIFTYQRGQIYTSGSGYTQVSRYVKHGDVNAPGNSQYSGVTENDLYTDVYPSSIGCNSPLIKSITWHDMAITFNYTLDRQEIMKERLADIQVKQGVNLIKKVVFSHSYFGTKSYNKRLKLDKVSFPESNETYSFNYNTTLNSSLPDYYYSPGTSVHCAEDYWGYWNGTSSGYVFPSAVATLWNKSVSPYTIPSTDRSVKESYTKACILEEIIYPTKGKTRFEYEINRASGAFNPDKPSDQKDIVGGLRLKKQTDYSDAGIVAGIKEYEYSGICFMQNTYAFETYFHYTGMFLDWYLYMISNREQRAYFPYNVTSYISTPFLSLSGMSSSPVFYNQVKEYDGTASNHNGWTDYSYIMSENSSYNCYMDGPQMPRALIESVDCDHGFIRGHLYSRIVYNRNGKPVFSSLNTYNTATTRIFPTGIRLTQSVETDNNFPDAMSFGGDIWYRDYFLNNIIAYSTFAYEDYEFLKKTTNSWYENGIQTRQETTEYEYDYKNDGNPVLLTPRSVSRTNSTGKVHTQTTVFPYHTSYKNSFPYNLMNSYNMLEYPLEIKNHVGSDTLSNVRTQYTQVSGKLILPKRILVGSGNNALPKERIVYPNYDMRGNLQAAVKDNLKKVVYLWSYNYRYPILKVEGATYGDVIKAIGYTEAQINALAAQTAPSATQITQLKTAIEGSLKNVFVTCYTYKPAIGILSATDLRGIVTSYTYDNAGRLIDVMENDGSGQKIKEHYEYNYGN